MASRISDAAPLGGVLTGCRLRECRFATRLVPMPAVEGEDEAEKRPSRIPESAAAVGGALAGWRLGPGGELVGAAAGPLLKDMASKAWDEFTRGAQRRQEKMLASAAKASRSGPEEVVRLIAKSEHTHLLTATAMDGAARTAWPPKVAALGRALADGLIAESDTQIDAAELILPAMADMDRPHVSLLELFVRWIPDWVGHHLSPRAYRDLPPDHPGDWAPRERIWSAREIGQARPPLQPVITSLIGTVQRHGLAVEASPLPGVLARYAQELDRSQRGNAPKISEFSMRQITPPPRWSPTELGERVLRYYHLAANEFVDNPALAPGDE